ncbi:hypothetical protein FBU30_007024 [Linnemannia zychae]|nr:hypothetical protein FBU30_007024 [Linnemannia zychae]
MDYTSRLAPVNPLEIPEIRVLIAKHLDRRDAVPCMRVSQDWFRDFAPVVWYEIDFSKRTPLYYITSNVLQKYGSYIGRVCKVSTLQHLLFLQHSNVDSIRYLHWCPLLNTITFGPDNTELMSDLLLGPLSGLKTCTFPAINISKSTALGLIANQGSLTSLTIGDNIKDPISMTNLHLILKFCHNLREFSAKSIVIDIEAAMQQQETYQELSTLSVRLANLVTSQNIDLCLLLLQALRRDETANVAKLISIHATAVRLAKYLNQFKQLKKVWLGTRDYYIPPKTSHS